MHAYRFRILSEEQDDFLRDVEVLATHTFEEFHKYLMGLFEFESNELASFSICNGKWFKLSEITLIDMRFEEQTDDFEDEELASKPKMKTYLMSESRIKNFIEDPHQRIIYEYDFLKLKTFYLELAKIVQAEDGAEYPRCVKSEGSLPKKVQPIASTGMEDLADIGLFEEMQVDEIEFEDEIDDGFSKNIGDGFEIESDQTADMNIDERFDGNFEEGGRN